MLEAEKVEKLLERNTIEVAPIAFMRGRTLNDSFIIMDEAQNSTPEQMKMILTRQGFNSKMVVTGDPTQIDLPGGQRSGLIEVVDVLRGVEGISFVQFDDRDVVRHSLVQKIVKAYERYNEAHRRRPPVVAEAGGRACRPKPLVRCRAEPPRRSLSGDAPGMSQASMPSDEAPFFFACPSRALLRRASGAISARRLERTWPAGGRSAA